MTDTPLIEIFSAKVDFPGAPRIPPMSFNVMRGEFVWLTGPSGCGKSLALKLISALLQPTAGQVRVAGDLINNYSEKQALLLRRSMGIMPQEGLLLEDHSILENVMLPAIAAEESSHEARRRALLALEQCGIVELAKLPPSGLSAGQRQLACLARAIVNRPVVILADEPASHLDIDNAQHLMDLLGTFSLKNVAVVVASHLEIFPRTAPCRTVELGGPL